MKIAEYTNYGSDYQCVNKEYVRFDRCRLREFANLALPPEKSMILIHETLMILLALSYCNSNEVKTT